MTVPMNGTNTESDIPEVHLLHQAFLMNCISYLVYKVSTFQYTNKLVTPPTKLGVRNHLQSSYSDDDFCAAQSKAKAPGPPASYDFLILFKEALNHLNLSFPSNVKEAVRVYISVSHLLNYALFNIE